MPTTLTPALNIMTVADFIAAREYSFRCYAIMEEIGLTFFKLSTVLSKPASCLLEPLAKLWPGQPQYSRMTRAIGLLCEHLSDCGVCIGPATMFDYQADWSNVRIPMAIGKIRQWLMIASTNPNGSAHEIAFQQAYQCWWDVEIAVSREMAERDITGSFGKGQNFRIDPLLIEMSTESIPSVLYKIKQVDFRKAKVQIERESAKAIDLCRTRGVLLKGTPENRDQGRPQYDSVGPCTVVHNGSFQQQNSCLGNDNPISIPPCSQYKGTTAETPQPKEQTKRPVKQSKCVRLFGPSEGPVVNGIDKPRLTAKRYDTIQALIEAGEEGLSMPELDVKSGHTESRKALADMIKNDKDWAAVIVMAGGTGNRYHIR